MSRIELKKINKFYGDNHVLKDLDLTIEDGDFMTLLGPSGCGKTTTLRVISGLENPQGGVMLIDGKEAWLCVAKIGETRYDTIDEAMAAAQPGDTVKLVADIVVEDTVKIPAGKTVHDTIFK